MITIVVAAALDGAIGKNGNLLWHLGGDLRRFKELTMGHAVVMGRKTWESLPRRPLPGRLNVVVTRDAVYSAPGAFTAPSIEEALEVCTREQGPESHIFVIGGGSIYAQALPLCDSIDLTLVEARFPEADTFFPLPDKKDWETVSRSEPVTDPRSGLVYRHIFLRRKA